jgi:hypothetical protein|tara:strand:- start:1214 stop:1729 length:516 start_codon:yes stop_codon:yes gene_type:complete
MKIYKDFFPSYIYEIILKYLEKTPFVIDPTPLAQDIDKSVPRLTPTSYQGFIHQSFPQDPHSNLNLNFFAGMALIKIKNEEKKIFNLERVLFNYLTKGTVGQLHYDAKEDNAYTFILNLTDGDGGTQVNNKFYKNNFNEGLLFKSNILHQGIGPTEGLYRQNMALILREQQ